MHLVSDSSLPLLNQRGSVLLTKTQEEVGNEYKSNDMKDWIGRSIKKQDLKPNSRLKYSSVKHDKKVPIKRNLTARNSMTPMLAKAKAKINNNPS